jgi:hypothetical protein
VPSKISKSLQAVVATVLLCTVPVWPTAFAKSHKVVQPPASVAEVEDALRTEAPDAGASALAQIQVFTPHRNAGYLWRNDRENTDSRIYNFRTSRSALNKGAWRPSEVGLRELRISGSGQPDGDQFGELISTLKKEAVSGPIYIVDLREESHGFFDKHAASWYGKHNWANVGMTTEAIRKDESKRLNAEIGKIVSLSTFKKGKVVLETPLLVHNTATEAQLVEAAGGKYARFTLSDQVGPDPAQVDAFLKFYRGLPQNAWLHFHCHAGMGRTTTFMTMVDIIKNAKNVPVEDIAARQYLLHGANLLGGLSSNPQSWNELAQEGRAQFVKYFYDYVQAYPKLNKSWSSWIGKQMPRK